MKNIYLVNYSVKGIKTLDELISLSFYKKTITPPAPVNNLPYRKYNRLVMQFRNFVANSKK